jgi:hypothetical protein
MLCPPIKSILILQLVRGGARSGGGWLKFYCLLWHHFAPEENDRRFNSSIRMRGALSADRLGLFCIIIIRVYSGTGAASSPVSTTCTCLYLSYDGVEGSDLVGGLRGNHHNALADPPLEATRIWVTISVNLMSGIGSLRIRN